MTVALLTDDLARRPLADKACPELGEESVRLAWFGLAWFGSRSKTMCFPTRRTVAMRLCSSTAAISRAEDFSGCGFCPSQTDSITSLETRLANPRAMVSTSGSSGIHHQSTSCLQACAGFCLLEFRKFGWEGQLIFQRNDGFSLTAESGHSLQIAVGLRQGHHRPIAVNGVAVRGKIPASAFGVLLEMANWPAHGLRRLGSGETKQQG